MYQTTNKQRRAAEFFLDTHGGTIHTVIIHDLGTSMRIITSTEYSVYSVIDVDNDFVPEISGERVMDKLRLSPEDQKEFLTTADQIEWPVEHPTDAQVQEQMEEDEDTP